LSSVDYNFSVCPIVKVVFNSPAVRLVACQFDVDYKPQFTAVVGETIELTIRVNNKLNSSESILLRVKGSPEFVITGNLNTTLMVS
jgi:hypothetical protein